MQRKFIWSIVGVCVLGIVALLIVFLMNTEKKTINATRVIPSDAAMIVQIKQIGATSNILTPSNSVWKAFSQFPLIEKGCDFICKLDSASKTDEKYVSIQENELFYVVKKSGANKLDCSYVIPLQKEQHSDFWKNFLEDAFDVTNPTITELEGKRIYSYKDDALERKNISFAFCDNILIISESKVMVESSLSASIDGKCLDDDSDFRKVKPNDSKVAGRIFFNYDRMVPIFQLYASEDYVKRTNSFPKIASWTVLDVTFADKIIRLNGMITLDSLTHSYEYFNVFRKQQAYHGKIASVMPASTSYFVAVNVTNKDEFRKDYEQYLKQNNYFNSYDKNLKDCGLAFALSFYDLLDKEMAYVMMPSSSNKRYENVFAVFKLSDTKEMEKNLIQKLQSLNQNTASESYQNCSIFYLQTDVLSRLPQKLFGNLFQKITGQYVTFVDDYMIFANSDQSIKLFIDDFEKDNVLAKNANYIHFLNNIKSSYSLYAYVSIPQSVEMFKDFCEKETISMIDSYADKLHDMNAISYQIIADDDVKLYNDIVISYEPAEIEKPTIEWRLALDSTCTIIGKPTIFMTHRNEFATLVQDNNNCLYFIDNDATGEKIIWKRQLNGPIIGDIHFVDAMNNTRIQYLFVTDKSVYVIDRNGNNVGNFPITLASSPTADVAVFDYDKLKKYRLAIPCADNTIVLYSLENGLGTKIQWNAKSDGLVNKPLQHFSDNGKDYIVYFDQYHVYIVNRRGDIRVDLNQNLLAVAKNTEITFDKGADSSLSKFVLTDADGFVTEIGLDGSIKQNKDFGQHSSQHKFLARDIDGDGNLEYIFADESKVEVYSQMSKRLFTYSSQDAIVFLFVRTIGEESYICLRDSKNKLYILKSDGTLWHGFPIDGMSNFDIGVNTKHQSKGFNLFVGGEQNLLYNYMVK